MLIVVTTGRLTHLAYNILLYINNIIVYMIVIINVYNLINYHNIREAGARWGIMDI